MSLASLSQPDSSSIVAESDIQRNVLILVATVKARFARSQSWDQAILAEAANTSDRYTGLMKLWKAREQLIRVEPLRDPSLQVMIQEGIAFNDGIFFVEGEGRGKSANEREGRE